MGRFYARVVGVVLTLVGVAGFFAPNPLGLPTTTAFNIFHVVAGVWGLVAGFGNGLGGPKIYARVFAIIPTVVGLLGFVAPSVLAGLGIPSAAPYNVFHLILGVWGLWAGYRTTSAGAM